MPEDQDQNQQGNQGGSDGNDNSVNLPDFQTWRKAVPEFAAEKSLETYKDFNAVCKSLVHAEKRLGSAVFVPGENAKPEEFESFYSKLGRPAKPEEYKYKLPNIEYIDWNPDQVGSFLKAAHKVGLNTQQVQAILEYEGGRIADAIKAQKDHFDKTTEELKTLWGGTFEKNVALVRRFVATYGDEEAAAVLKSDPLGNTPWFLRMLARAAADAVEGEYLGGPGESTGLTSEEARARINEIRNNPDDLFHAKFAGKPGHDERVREVQELYDIVAKRV